MLTFAALAPCLARAQAPPAVETPASPGFFNPGAPPQPAPGARPSQPAAAPPGAAPPGKAPPVGASPGLTQPAMTQPGPGQPPPATQPPGPAPDVWLPRTVADVQALDKVSAHVQSLALHIGAPQSFGSLTITLRACMVRPPDQPQDSAAFLEVTDAEAKEPGFRGWMFASEPEVAMLESPIYDLRLNGCHS